MGFAGRSKYIADSRSRLSAAPQNTMACSPMHVEVACTVQSSVMQGTVQLVLQLQ
jgi:hypothetical protein